MDLRTRKTSVLRAVCAFACLGFLCLTTRSPLAAESNTKATMPPLYGVTEMVMQSTRFGDRAASQSCGLTHGDLTDALFEKIKTSGLPITSLIEAKPPIIGAAQVELVPEIYTQFNATSGRCLSWIILAVSSSSPLVVPPVTPPRHVVVTFWRGGNTVSSRDVAHAQAVGETLQKLGQKLIAQYKADQPNLAPPTGK